MVMIGLRFAASRTGGGLWWLLRYAWGSHPTGLGAEELRPGLFVYNRLLVSCYTYAVRGAMEMTARLLSISHPLSSVPSSNPRATMLS